MANVTTSTVTFGCNGDTVPGYLAQPQDGPGPRPGVVVIQEWWGLNDHIKDVTRRLAAEGFVALAPDLYRGQTATEPDEARKLIMNMGMEAASKDIEAAIAYLSGLDAVAPKKIGVVGFCVGGRLTNNIAVTGAGAGAAVAFYGGVDIDPRHVVVPLLALYGEDDAGSPPERIAALRQQFAGQNGQVISYPGADHAFFNDTRPVYNAQASADAWTRTLAWFHDHLT